MSRPSYSRGSGAHGHEDVVGQKGDQRVDVGRTRTRCELATIAPRGRIGGGRRVRDRWLTAVALQLARARLRRF